MIELTNKLIRDAIQRLGYGEAEPGRLHLVGIRSCRRVGPTTITRRQPQPNRYDDVIATFGTHLEVFPATVDPGARFTRRPSRPDGCAHLADGGPYHYVVGLHRRKRALLQAGPVMLWRDKDRDGGRDPSEFVHAESGNGLNIHRGGNAPTVDAWSAGCQVIPVAFWPQFWDVIDRAHRAGQRSFLYWLIDGPHLPSTEEGTFKSSPSGGPPGSCSISTTAVPTSRLSNSAGIERRTVAHVSIRSAEPHFAAT